MSNTPVSHIDESLGLEATSLVPLFEIQLVTSPTVLFFRSGPTVTYQGDTYEQVPCVLSGEKLSADGEVNRPTFTFYNQDNVFGPLIDQGTLDRALLIRKVVLNQHLNDDVDISKTTLFTLGRLVSMSKRQVSFTLHTLSDSPRFKFPGRHFTPPEFPFVTPV